MTTPRPRSVARVAMATIIVAAALSACSSRDGDAAKGTSTTSAPSGTTGTGTTGSAPVIPFNPGERAGLGPWQLTLVDSTLGAVTTVRVDLLNPGTKARPAPPASIFELIDLATRNRYPVASSTGLGGSVPAGGTSRITLTFDTGTPPGNAVLAWRGSTYGSVDAAFALTAAPAPD